jgi:xylan 1,4-beta-xylosidase
LVAEGGTGYQHAVTMARSKTLTGPYEVHSNNPLLTSQDDPENPLQRAGHADLVDTPEGDTYLVHLCSRPLPGTRLSPMGRETAIQRVEWGEDGWLRLEDGGNTPVLKVALSGVTQKPPAPEEHYDFETDTLPAAFQWLRTPYPDRLFSLTERPGYLRLFGRESVGSWFEQALVARRQDNIHCSAETTLKFEPEDIQQFAGLIAYYNRFKFHYLAVTLNDTGSKVLSVISCLDDWPNGNLDIADTSVHLAPDATIRLGLDIHARELRFRYAQGNQPWQPIGLALDAGLLSDEGSGRAHGYFTGNFLGMAAHDISGRGTPADFQAFCYRRAPLSETR